MKLPPRITRFHHLFKRLRLSEQIKFTLMIVSSVSFDIAQHQFTQSLRNIRLYFGNFPVGLALIHALVTFIMLGIVPPLPDTPGILLAINYILSFYIAAWLWFILNRKFRPLSIRYT